MIVLSENGSGNDGAGMFGQDLVSLFGDRQKMCNKEKKGGSFSEDQKI